MNERVVVPSAGIRLSSLAAPRVVEVAKPAQGQAITLDLDKRYATTLDFSAVANEKLKLVQSGAKLIVEFDNHSPIIADPFFDSSGKPLPYLEVEFGGTRAMSSEQFSALLAETVGQPTGPDEDKIPPSGANFVDASVDMLPESLRPLALLGLESHKSATTSSFAGDDGEAHQHALQQNIVPVITIPSAGGPATLVFEGGLLASRGAGESAGSHAGSPAFPVTTRLGTINFNSLEGIQSISLGGHLLTTSPQTFTDATGSLTASYSFDTTTHKGAINYTYTLLDNTIGIPAATFAVMVTDSDGHSNAPGNLVITIADDAPIARADADNVASGQVTAETGNVLTGIGTALGPAGADVAGADGGISIVGVAAGNGPGTVNPGSVGAAIAGAFGTLMLNADGSYSYLHAVGGGADVFTYTIRDADGSPAHTTLTIRIPDSAPVNILIPPAGNPAAGTEVFEAGLPARTIAGIAEPAGSHAGNPAFAPATSGTITFVSADGVSKVELGGLTLTAAGAVATFTDATGSLTASYTNNSATGQGTISYTYTLLDNTLADPSGKSFAVAVTDVDGDRTQGGNLTITIVDDAPVAHADTDSFAVGQVTAETGNVLTGVGTTSGASGADVAGADGAAVAGVAAGNTGTDLVNAATVGATIAGAFGRLTLNADGSYSYTHAGSPGGGNDVFTYTVRDADGDLSHATLTIAVADSIPGNIVIPPPGSAGAGTEVFEAGLPASRGPGESAGSDAGNPDGNAPIATSGAIAFTSADGVSKVELGALVLTAANISQTFTDATGSLTASYTYNSATGQGTISYTYTLRDNTLGTPSASFAVAVTDADGDRSAGGNLVITIADDGPVAHADTDSVAAGQLTGETGNVLTGIGTTSGAAGADVSGADGGAAIVGVDAGNTAGGVNPGTLGVAITGALGALTLNADGSYNYVHSAGAGGGNDVFTYTIRDADGSLSHATLTIAVADSSPGNIVIPSAGGAATTVFEAGLLAARGAGESAGSHSGHPAFPTTTQTGTITFTSPDGVTKIELGGLTLTAAGTPGAVTDATGSLTASYTYNAATGQGTISYAYTLLDNTLGAPSASFAVAVTDGDGDRTVGGNLVITIVDDVPAAHADTDGVAAGQVTAETGNVITGVGPGGADVQGADGAVVAGVALGNTGADLVNAGTVGSAIIGAFGTLTLNADGSYSYAHTGAAGGGSDVFTYTLRDADGSLSHATLTIAVADSSPGGITIPPAGGTTTTVFEAGLLASRGVGESAGSHSGDPTFPATTQTGAITFASADGVSKIELGGLALTAVGTAGTFTDETGALTASYTYSAASGQGTISYSYTLLDNTLGTSNASFAVAVTDADGDRTVGGNLVINIVDDSPVAIADTDSVAAGQVTAETGNVLTGVGTTSGTASADVAGADGGVTVISVAAGGSTVAVDPAAGVTIAGAFGTLTINADGSYSYTREIGEAGGGHTDSFTYTIQDADGSQSTATLAIAVANSVPGDIVVPPPDTGETAVFEAGLPARTIGSVAEPAGSNPLDATTTTGAISFTSLDGVQSVALGTLVLHVGDAPQTFTDTTGQLTAFVTYDAASGTGEINYTYTLLDNTDARTTPSVTFAVAVTDLDGDRTAGNDLVITVVDDAPEAAPDSDAIVAGQTTPETGNVITGEGTDGGLNGSSADVPGADGATLVSIAFGSTAVTVDPAQAGTIAGAFGTLTINADGSYSYTRTGGSGADIFTYTIQDGDGTQSSATLTIDVGDSTPRNIVVPPPGGADTTVFEAGLLASRGVGESAGSHSGDPAFPVTTQTGAITFTSVDGVSKVELGGLTLTAPGTAGTFTDATGSLTATYVYDAATGQGTISYSYTLLDNAIGPASPSFVVAITDPDGDRTVGASLVISVVDDAPIALVDTDTFAAGQSTAETGNVISGAGTTSGNTDVQGADGGVTVIGVTEGDTGGGVVVGGVDAGIAGAFGTLTLNADGSYSYVHTGSAGGGIDVFTYAIQDADGSRSVATLTINVEDSAPGGITIPAAGGAATTVFEAGLLSSRGLGESAGSHSGDPAFPVTTQTGTITFTSPDGVSKIELGGLTLTAPGTPSTFTDATGTLTASYTYNAATGQGTVSYSYTLLDNTIGTPSVSFVVAVTDGDGDRTVGGNLVVNIVDDTPAAHADTDSVAAGQVAAETGNVLTGVGTTSGAASADVAGADGGLSVVGVTAGNGTTPVTGGLGMAIAGTFGSLTLNSDGSYSYAHTGSAGGGTDVFTYTVKDADASLSTATLTIAVDNATPGGISIPPPGAAGQGTLVDEAGLPTGSNPAANSEITSGKITFTSFDGVGSITLVDAAGNNTFVLDSSHNPQTFLDRNGIYSLTASYTISGGAGEIDYTYTLLQNAHGNPLVNNGDTSTSFNVTVADSNGDSAGGTLVVDIKDDHPAASGDTATTAVGVASGSVLANDTGGADGLRPAADGGAVVSVAGINGSAVAGQPLSGNFGTLTLTADGHYDYVRNGVAVPAGGGSDTFIYTIVDGDGTTASAQLVISVAPAPGNITIPGPGVAGAGTLVDEAGLPARGSEPAGSNAASSSETTSGTITFTSSVGVSQIELGGLTLKSSNGFAGTLSDATGTLTASLSSFDAQSGAGTVTYTYTLLDNTLGNPLVNIGDTSVSFAVAVTDGNNVRTVAGSNLVITVKDDHPTAHADAADLTDQTQAFGNVLANDVKGADNAVVSSIASATTPAIDVDIVGTTIQGAFGVLTIDRNGSYEYDLSLNVPVGFVDTFTYTILDFDGSTSTATLVIGANCISIPIDAAETTVFEAGLPARGSEPAGSDAGNPDGNATTATSGTIAFTSVSGITQIELGGLTLKSSNGFTGTLSDATGTLTASLSSFDAQSGAGTVTYTYTLLDNTLGNPLVNIGDTSVSFAVAVTDGNNVRTVAGSNLVITVKDDHPTASGDTATTAVGVASGSVLANDTGGADGLRPAADGGAVVSVAGINGSAVAGQPLSGNFGTLTLTADGHYDYVRNGVAVPAGGGSDTFTYTIVDGDGTRASAQLVISIPVAGTGPGPIGLPQASQPGVTEVFEAGLAARGSEPAGSDAGNTDGQAPVTATGSITFSAPDGLHTLSLGGNLVTATTQAQAQQTPFADGTRGQLVAWFTIDGAGNGTLNYIYTLLDNVANTADAPLNASFAVAVTDDDGRTASSNLVIAIADDHPTAKADTDSVAAGQITAEAGNVLDGTGTTSGPASADISGADGGITVVRVDSQFNESTVGRAIIVDPTVGATIQGDEGTLTILANGSYSYAHTGRPGGGPDQFTYTIKDADGSVSTASLTFTVADSAPGNFVIPPAGSVFEAGLLASRGSGESPGTDAGNPDGRAPTTTSGTFIFTSLDGITSITLIDAAKTGNKIVLDSAHPSMTILDPGYSLTASLSYDSAIGQGTVNYTYTLLDNTIGIPNTTFTATVQDLDDDSGTGNLVVNIVDDAPVANADTDFLALGSIAKVGNVVTGTGTTSGASGIDAAGADGGLQVVGVAAGNTGLDLVDLSTVGAEIHGSFGTLTLAGGPYLYERDPGPQPGGIPDVFTYTVRDADGSLSHTTLGITLADSAPSITSATTGTLFEAGLDARGNKPAGTHAGDFLSFPTVGEVDISFTSIDGIQSVTLDGVPVGGIGTFNADADPNTGLVIGEKFGEFSYDPASRTGTIRVVYQLTDNTDAGVTPSRSPNIVVTDLDGDTVSVKATFNIVDDAPIAVEDDIPVRTTASGNLTGNDITGADGFGSVIVVGVEANNTNRNHHGGVGSDINGRLGVLTVQEDGSFTYFNSSGQPTGVDLFTYTIQDSDGALSHALIAVTLGQSSGGIVVENQLLSQDHQLTSGSDLITGSGGLDNNFVVASSGEVNSGDSIHGSGEAQTTDTLNLVAAGAYNLTKVDITNVDSIVLGSNLGDGGNGNTSENFNVTVGDAAVSTADFNKDGLGGDLQISVAAPTSNGAVIDASSLTGSNHIVVDATNLNGDNIFKGGAGADILTGGNGNDILAGGGGIDTLKGAGGANHFVFNAPGEGGDHILDFKHGSDSIDILLANFAGLSGKGAVASSDFVTSDNAANVNLGPAHFAYNASSGQLFYDSNGGDASGASRVLLAVFDNHAALTATDIHKV